MPLTDRQATAVEILDWLLDQDESRQTGRTFVFAVSLIRQALRAQGQTVFLIDHWARDIRQGRRVLRDMILHLTESDPRLMGSAHIDVREDRLSIQPLSERTPLPSWRSWVPPESALEVMRVNLRSEMAEALSQERRLDELMARVKGAEPGTLGDNIPTPTRYEQMLDGKILDED